MPTKVAVEKLGFWARRWRRIRQVLRESFVDFFREDSLTISASIAYYSLLSLFPLMVLLVGLSGIYLRQHGELIGQLPVVLQRYLPMKPDFIMQNLVGISRAFRRISFISFLLLLWSASGVFLPLEKALNRAWDVEKQRSWWKSQLLALEMALMVGFLILVSMGLVGVNVYIHDRMRRWVFPGASSLVEFVYHILMIGTTFGMTLAMFVVLFNRLPNRPMRLRQVLPSAVLTALFWEAARSLFTLLLPRFNYRQVYGSLGAVVALMTWAYISSAVMLFGAQVSHALYGTLEADEMPHPAPSTPNVQSAGEAR